MSKCTKHNMKPIGTVELRLVNLTMEEDKLQSIQTDEVVPCRCLMCSTCGYIGLIELSGVVHDEEAAIEYSTSQLG